MAGGRKEEISTILIHGLQINNIFPPPMAGEKRRNFNYFETRPDFDAKPFFK
ncbi:MAG: hypothetical protein LBR79_05710 [Oscillospiraceae bacterium]|nr:hypothetical protein [Oscillospiraceae bacterium]